MSVFSIEKLSVMLSQHHYIVKLLELWGADTAFEEVPFHVLRECGLVLRCG